MIYLKRVFPLNFKLCDFLSLVRRFAIDFHGNECIILFLKRYFMKITHHSAKNNHQSFISPLSLRTVFADGTRTRGTGIVTSIILARANWRKAELHKWITTQPWIPISPHPVFTTKRVRKHHVILDWSHYIMLVKLCIFLTKAHELLPFELCNSVEQSAYRKKDIYFPMHPFLYSSRRCKI